LQNSLAPIALFVYNRPGHTRRTVEALLANPQAARSDLFVYADGPKSASDAGPVAEVRAYLAEVSGFKSLTVQASAYNRGLANSIIAGVSDMLGRFERVIVLEDDLVTSPHFLSYMNRALELYRDDERVVSVHGYIYPMVGELPETFFLRGADCWGWGTWRRGWRLFEPDGRLLLKELQGRRLTGAFDLGHAFPFTRMLREQVEGKKDSWAIRWHASAFLKGALTLYPGRTLVRNVGHDASGTNCGATKSFDSELAEEPVRLRRIPLVEGRAALSLINDYFWSLQPAPKRMLRRVLERLL